MKKWLFMIGAMSVSVPTTAETLATTGDLKSGTRIYEYVFSRPQIAEMHKVGVFWDKRLGLQQDCKSQFRVKPTAFVVVVPISFPDNNNHPTQGAWKHRFEFERCGETKIYNAIFLAKNGDTPETKPYFPGASIASPRLIADAMQTAVASASLKLRKDKGVNDCKDVVVSDMKISQAAHDVIDAGKTYSRVWQEDWTFLACGQSVHILMDFTPDGQGGTNYSTKFN